jgi:hypothetical protein
MFAFYHPYLDVLNSGGPHSRPNLPPSRPRPWKPMRPGRAVLLLPSRLPGCSVTGPTIQHRALSLARTAVDVHAGEADRRSLARTRGRRLRPHRIKMKRLGKHTRAPPDGRRNLSFATARWWRHKPGDWIANGGVENVVDAGLSSRQPVPASRLCDRSDRTARREMRTICCAFTECGARQPEEAVQQEY